MATDARNVTIPDEEWREVGEIAEKLERSRSWVIAKLISKAHEKSFRPTTSGKPYADLQTLEELGLR